MSVFKSVVIVLVLSFRAIENPPVGGMNGGEKSHDI